MQEHLHQFGSLLNIYHSQPATIKEGIYTTALKIYDSFVNHIKDLRETVQEFPNNMHLQTELVLEEYHRYSLAKRLNHMVYNDLKKSF